LALSVQAERGDKYRVLPLLLPGIKPAALGVWFDKEPLAVPVETAPGKLAEALPEILAGLGLRLPEDREILQQVAPAAVDELILELRDPGFAKRRVKPEGTENGTGTSASLQSQSHFQERAKATATLVFQPADPGQRPIESQRYTVTAPLGPIELEEIRWYLEDYFRWPVGVFKERAERTEAALPGWGRDLYQAADPATRIVFTSGVW
jgi:hypothetical protein